MSRSYPTLFATLLVIIISSGLIIPTFAQPLPKLIVNPTSITAEVSTTFTITFSVTGIPSGYGLRYVGIVLLWPSSDMELVSGIEGASAPPGWNPTLVDPTTIPPGSEGKYFQMSINTGEHVTVDREWLTVTFHCLGSGPSTISIDGSLELRELPAGSIFGGPVDPIEVTINQIASVGGVTTPVNKTEILTPYLALAGLIAVISAVYVIKKRKE
ncbi:hypothetical protein ACFLQ6_04765 [Thermoproteota archaeon]